MAHELMAQIVHRSTLTEKSSGDNKRKHNGNNKRKWDEIFDNANTGQQLAKRPETIKAYAPRSDEKRYKGNKPLCSQCDNHHEGPCGATCNKCQSHGHQTMDCRVKVCFECGNTRRFKNACTQLNDDDNNARDRA